MVLLFRIHLAATLLTKAFLHRLPAEKRSWRRAATKCTASREEANAMGFSWAIQLPNKAVTDSVPVTEGFTHWWRHWQALHEPFLALFLAHSCCLVMCWAGYTAADKNGTPILNVFCLGKALYSVPTNYLIKQLNNPNGAYASQSTRRTEILCSILIVTL